MRQRKGRARRTHYAVNQAGDTDTGNPTPANSLSPAIIHLFECDDATHDDFTGSGETITVAGTNTVVGAVANSVRMVTWYATDGNSPLTSGWTAPSGKDFLIMVCYQCVTGGVGSFYMGDGNQDHIRVQHYLAAHGALYTTESVIDTAPTAGSDYIYAAVYRNGTLEHYTTTTDGTVYHANDVAVNLSSFTPHNGFNCSHGKLEYDDVGIVEVNQDYYGFLVAHFTNGSPSESDIISAMEYHLAQWPAGNKAVYPGWMSEV